MDSCFRELFTAMRSPRAGSHSCLTLSRSSSRVRQRRRIDCLHHFPALARTLIAAFLAALAEKIGEFVGGSLHPPPTPGRMAWYKATMYPRMSTAMADKRTFKDFKLAWKGSRAEMIWANDALLIPSFSGVASCPQGELDYFQATKTRQADRCIVLARSGARFCTIFLRAPSPSTYRSGARKETETPTTNNIQAAPACRLPIRTIHANTNHLLRCGCEILGVGDPTPILRRRRLLPLILLALPALVAVFVLLFFFASWVSTTTRQRCQEGLATR